MKIYKSKAVPSIPKSRIENGHYSEDRPVPLRTTIPYIIVCELDIHIGDELRWEIDRANNEIKIKILKKE